MVFSARATSRVVAAGIIAGILSSAMLFGSTGVTMADPPDPAPAPLSPNCTEADFFQISAGVATATSRYLFAHPDANANFTGVKGAHDQLQQYKSSSPQAQADLEGIRQPLVDFLNRCQKQ